MRTLVSVTDDPTLWFDNLDSRSLSASIRELTEKSILLSSKARKRDLINATSSLADNAKERIIGFIESVPMAIVEDRKRTDISVGIVSDELRTFEDELETIASLFEERRRGATKVDLSKDVYERTLGVLSSAASEVHIYDKYFLSCILNKNFIVISEILKNLNLAVYVHSGVSKLTSEKWELGKTPEADWVSRINEIRSEWERLLKLHRPGKDSRCHSSLDLIAASRGKLRNRSMIFKFNGNNTRIAINLPHGIDDFGNPYMKETNQFGHETNTNVISSITGDWDDELNRIVLATFAWSGERLVTTASREFPNLQII